jgi:hypothetical protein
MPQPIRLFDTVAVTSDVPELDLFAGEVGAVVEVLSDYAFEVEFCDDGGLTYGLHTLRANQLLALHMKGSPLRSGRMPAA